MRTPENLVHHELIGLKVNVVGSSNPKNIGIKGKIVDETRDTLVIEKLDGREAKMIKEENVFVFVLDRKMVKVDGKILVGRPEDRIKKKFKNW